MLELELCSLYFRLDPPLMSTGARKAQLKIDIDYRLGKWPGLSSFGLLIGVAAAYQYSLAVPVFALVQ